jgi:hypothetical protein
MKKLVILSFILSVTANADTFSVTGNGEGFDRSEGIARGQAVSQAHEDAESYADNACWSSQGVGLLCGAFKDDVISGRDMAIYFYAKATSTAEFKCGHRGQSCDDLPSVKKFIADTALNEFQSIGYSGNCYQPEGTEVAAKKLAVERADHACGSNFLARRTSDWKLQSTASERTCFRYPAQVSVIAFSAEATFQCISR